VAKRHQGVVRSRLVLAPGSSMSSMKASDHKDLNLVLDRIAGELRQGGSVADKLQREQPDTTRELTTQVIAARARFRVTRPHLLLTRPCLVWSSIENQPSQSGAQYF
jgi:hypothetical protein